MFGGGDLSKVLVQENSKLKEEGAHKQSCTPYLAANLALLNNLARNDLNFQNLLVLHNLVSLGMEVEVTKILNDGQKHNHNSESLHSTGRQHRNHSKHHKMHQQPVFENTNNKITTNCTNSDIVMGYPPAADCPLPQDHSNKWNAINNDTVLYNSSRDASLWTPSHYPSGDETDVRSGSHLMESCGSNLEDGIMDNTDYEKFDRKFPIGGGYYENHIEESKGSLIRCKSWPDPLSSPSPSFDQELYRKQDFGFLLDDGEIVDYPSFMKNESEDFEMKSDIERFIEVATPTISSQAKTPITIDDIWEFYQIPSVYGLQVPLFKGSKGVSFAHFVPSLSAIRLFIPASPVQSEEEEKTSPELYLCDMPGCPRYLKLAFEFFEELVPHVRPPFSSRLKDLTQMGSPECQIPNLALRDVHPASWFAVAWYPVYCIPEGKLRTSFLTFHSFGSSHPSFDNSLLTQNQDAIAPLIGIKFLSLGKEAWLRPKRCSMTEACSSPHTNNVPMGKSQEEEEDEETEPLDGQIPLVKSTTNSENVVSIKNGMSMIPMERRPTQRHRELENSVDLLQSKAEILARASYLRVMCRPSNTIESARCWHSDFEFFHQRG